MCLTPTLPSSQSSFWCDLKYVFRLDAPLQESKHLVSADTKNTTYRFKYSLCLELCPLAKEELVCLDQKTAAALGGVPRLRMCVANPRHCPQKKLIVAFFARQQLQKLAVSHLDCTKKD